MGIYQRAFLTGEVTVIKPAQIIITIKIITVIVQFIEANHVQRRSIFVRNISIKYRPIFFH